MWGIASQDNESSLAQFITHYGLTFPILFDASGSVHNKYQQHMAFPSAAYPQDWVIDTNGKIIYINNGYELDSMIDSIEQSLESSSLNEDR